MHVIGQQLDRIEEKIGETTTASKPEKPLIDLPSQREKVKFKTSQAKNLDIVEKMFSDLKVKTGGTSTSAARTISRNEKESISVLESLFLVTKNISSLIFVTKNTFCCS